MCQMSIHIFIALNSETSELNNNTTTGKESSTQFVIKEKNSFHFEKDRSRSTVMLMLLSANGSLIVFPLFSLFAPSGQMLSDSVRRSKQQQVKSDCEDVNKDDGRD